MDRSGQSPITTKTMPPDTARERARRARTEALGGARPFTLASRRRGLAVCAQRSERWSAARPTTNRWNRWWQIRSTAQQTNPAADARSGPTILTLLRSDARFPFVLTTYRLTEHHTAGGMSRHLSHLSELQPELFTEVSPELAAEIGLEHGDWATIMTPRAVIEARVLVTPRMRPLRIDGRTVHQVGLPYHWGYQGQVKGDVVNDLLAISEEPNVRIMETKALVCNVVPGRRAARRRKHLRASGSRTNGQTRMSVTRISHRLHAVHRLQSLRSCLQGMERRLRRRLRLERLLLRQHRRGGSLHLAACEIRGSRPRCRASAAMPPSRLLELLLRCLQALRKGRLPGGLSHWLDRAHRVRRRFRSARCLQWLRLLRRLRVPSEWCERNQKDGRAFKCTFCYDRQKVGLQPACAKACPTESIKFGEIDDLRQEAQERVEELHRRGMDDATIYDPLDTSVGGTHALFIVRGDPRTYNLPPAPEVPTMYLKKGWRLRRSPQDCCWEEPCCFSFRWSPS